jgi:hypothetical protein
VDSEHQTVAILQSQESYADTPVSSEHDAIEMMIRTLPDLLNSVGLFTISIRLTERTLSVRSQPP